MKLHDYIFYDVQVIAFFQRGSRKTHPVLIRLYMRRLWCFDDDQKSYWCGTTRSLTGSRSTVNHCNGLTYSTGDERDDEGDDESLLIPGTQTESNGQQPAAASADYFEARPPGLQAGISIRNLRKVTGEGVHIID
jgi:hypothetical protein